VGGRSGLRGWRAGPHSICKDTPCRRDRLSLSPELGRPGCYQGGKSVRTVWRTTLWSKVTFSRVTEQHLLLRGWGPLHGSSVHLFFLNKNCGKEGKGRSWSWMGHLEAPMNRHKAELELVFCI
jgi:hypothetical protein